MKQKDEKEMDQEKKLAEKEKLLQQNLLAHGRLAVAYSGGIDSHFLLTAAIRALGREKVLAVLCRGVMMPEAETREALRALEELGVAYEVLEADVLALAQFAANGKRRCYFCKKYLLGAVQERARQRGFAVVADGKNADDAQVYRPGARAAAELGVCSPLFESGFSKQEIRACAKKWGIRIWDKPSKACLASRFPYDTVLTAEKLKQVERAEAILQKAGFTNCRVRAHEKLARIEVPVDEIPALVQKTELAAQIKALGFAFVTLDLQGLRSGVFD